MLIDVPEELDLSGLRGRGLQPGEATLPEAVAAEPAPPAPVQLDEAMVMQLASMGFDIEGCKKAVFHTQNQGRATHSSDTSTSKPSAPPSLPPSLRSRSSDELGTGAHG